MGLLIIITFHIFHDAKERKHKAANLLEPLPLFPCKTMSHPIIYFSHNIKVNLHISTRYSGTQTHWLQTICPPRQHQHSLSQQSKTPQAMKAPQAMKVALVLATCERHWAQTARAALGTWRRTGVFAAQAVSKDGPATAGAAAAGAAAAARRAAGRQRG